MMRGVVLLITAVCLLTIGFAVFAGGNHILGIGVFIVAAIVFALGMARLKSPRH